MPNDAADPSVSSTVIPKKKGGKKKARTRARSYVWCAICHERLPYLTPEHLQEHGYSIERYQRVFLAQACPPSPRADLVRVLAEDLVTRGEFVRVLADEVAEAIFSGPMRDKLRLGLVSVISTRLSQHGESVAALAKIRRELSSPWRVEQGGELGKPTETRELVGMAMQLHSEVSRGEDLLLKAVKLAIEERKGLAAAASIRGGLAPYTGDAEVIPIPAELSPGEREDIRHLLTELTQSVRHTQAGNPPLLAPVAEPLHIHADGAAESVPTLPPEPLPPSPVSPRDDIDPFAM